MDEMSKDSDSDWFIVITDDEDGGKTEGDKHASVNDKRACWENIFTFDWL